MTCTPFRVGDIAGIVCGGDPQHEVFDGRRTWRWQEGHYGGPLLVDRNGRVLDRQPGPRSRFWDVWETYWQERNDAR